MASLATWRRDLDLDRLEDEQKLPRGLLSSVLRHESAGDPNATSKAGAGGLFQLMPATAASYKADPYNPQQAAPAAAKELGSHWRRYGGDLSQTLAAWNWGSGNLQRKGLENAPTETRNFIRNVSRGVGDRYAGGDTVTDMPLSTGSKTASPSKPWLDMVPDEPPPEYRTTAPAPRETTQAPTRATAKPWLDMVPDEPPPAYRTAVPAQTPPETAAPAAQPPAVTPQAPAPDPLAQGPAQRVDRGQFMQQQAPQAVQAMAGSGVQDIEPLSPAGVPGALADAQTPAGFRLMGPDGRPHPQEAQVGARLAQQGQPLSGTYYVRGDAPADALLTNPASAISPTPTAVGTVRAARDVAQDVGYGTAGAVAGAALGGVPGMVAGPVIAQGALDRARMQLGLRPQEKAVFETGLIDVYQTDLLNAGLGLLTGAPDLLRSALGKTMAGKAITKATKESKEAFDHWQASETARKQAFDEGRTFDRETYDINIAERKTAYEKAAQKRNDLIAKDQAEFDRATQEYQTLKAKRDTEVADIDTRNAEVQRRFTEEQAAYPDVRAKQVAEAEAAAVEKAAVPVRRREAEYSEKVGRAAAQTRTHQEALERAQMLPEMYKETGDPSHVRYERAASAAQGEYVDPSTGKAALQQFRDEDYRKLLDDSNAPLPNEVKFYADQLEKLPADEPASVTGIWDTMKKLGPLTSSPSGDVRRTASALYGIYSDMLEQHPKLSEAIRDANKTFKREKAVETLGKWTGKGTEGSLVTRAPRGEGYQLNVKGLLDRFDKAGNNKLFRGAFDDEEWAALTKDMDDFRGTPGLPRPVTPLTTEQRTIAPGEPSIPAEKPPVLGKLEPYPKELPPEPVLKTKEPPEPFAPRPFEQTVPGRREFKEMPPPPDIEAQLASTPKEFFQSGIGRGSSVGGMAYMLSRAGVSPTMVDNMIYLGLAGIGAGVVGGTMNYAVSKALMTDPGRRLLKAAMGPGGRLDPNFFGAFVSTLSAAERAEFMREMPKEPEKKARR